MHGESGPSVADPTERWNLVIEPGSPWENGYHESVNGKLRDELLHSEIFYSLREAHVLIEWGRHHDNQIRPRLGV